ncbi:indolepyruvate ferredoxin oxidoreductase subunit alpha [Thermodesulforhabdus norvegica]|uniref:Indolepyruvate oxidoreductase subunit IorA n=1 Tax=Thermodesulforhabdus norvegica TaxID=39841 RepID=A0A1I4TY95_9BACT|nr:indolepyruvate ferredoxin oxidoreductase subunit alpha [Thermodesulforhabdus norvegica]SFM81776.1 indolepyruvate ferredoxin oxidoreductase alpha subunit [Thermodesulforhabdus norvegica]
MERLLTAEKAKLFLLGNEAIVRGALESGVSYATAYPGTPSSEIIDTMYRLREASGIRVEYAVNEKVSVEAAAAVAVSGLRSLVSMKHVGLNVAADAFMTLAYVGVRAGMVIVTADDPSLHSSQNEQDNRWYARMALVPMLEPSTPDEAYRMTRYGFELSEKFGIPCLLRTTTRVSHARGVVKVGSIASRNTPRGHFEKNPMKYVVVPMVGRELRLQLLEKWSGLEKVSEGCEFNLVEEAKNGERNLGIITGGVSYLYVKDALQELGLDDKINIAKLGMTSPFPEKFVADFLSKVDRVLVVEELEPYLEDMVRVCAQKYGQSKKIREIEGKSLIPRAFELNVPVVRSAIAEFARIPKPEGKVFSVPPLPQRPPNLCPGCPHRATYYAIKQVFGDDAIYPTDIGCYTLGLLPPLKMADFLLCMGSSVSTAGGFSIAQNRPVVAFIGDSTFFHAGIPGLINSVYNNHRLLLVILDNSTTAMTGHQPHPGASMTPEGIQEPKLKIEEIVKSCGVKGVEVVNPLQVKKTLQTIEDLKKALIESPGVYVLIARSPCPLLARRVTKQPQRVYFKVDETCDGCARCLEELACPAFVAREGKVHIDRFLCIGCAVCAQICTSIRPQKIDGRSKES